MSQMDGTSEVIDGQQYLVYMLPPMTSHDLLLDVVKMIGPALGPVFDVLFSDAVKKGKPEVLDQQVGPDFFTKAASALFSGIDKSVVRNVIDRMAEVTHVDGKPLKGIFEIHFRGRLDVMYLWLAFAMKVQWGKSFGVLGSVLGSQGAKLTPQVFQSPNT